MSFDIKLQHNGSEKYVVNKNITDLLTVSGTLKEGTSIVDPTFLIEGAYENLGNFNYLTVDSFHRKYYVRDVVQYRTGLLSVDCHSDVLSCDIDTLKLQKGIIKRQEFLYNKLLNDSSIKAYQNSHVIQIPFPDGFEDSQYILLVAGVAQATGIRIITQPTNCPVANVGDTATFTVVADGYGIRYQWQVRYLDSLYDTWYSIEYATNATYTFTTISGDANKLFRCQLTSVYGSTAYTNEVKVVFS